MSKQQERQGALRAFLRRGDGHMFMRGWKSLARVDGRANPHGWALVWAVVQKMVDGKLKDLYDQPVIVESPGAMVVCTYGNKVGLVQNYRFCGSRLERFEKFKYVLGLIETGKWEKLFASMGSFQWEVPRGLVPPDSTAADMDLEQFILKVARAEALAEAGFVLRDARVLTGVVNANTTFFLHGQYTVLAEVDAVQEQSPEDLEILGNVKFFTAREIRAMVDSGELQDGLTLAALAKAGWNF